jgi:N6-L-threonylcarbamoyladenine synthase
MGLGFPGGPAIDAASEGGDPAAVEFPRALPDRPYDFSFSGLKTSVVTYIDKARRGGDLPPLADVAASVQEAIVDVLVDKTFNAVDETEARIVGGGGGVLANRRLRHRFAEEADKRGVTLAIPEPILCTDNAAESPTGPRTSTRAWCSANPLPEVRGPYMGLNRQRSGAHLKLESS